jgi:hypothetical protein
MSFGDELDFLSMDFEVLNGLTFNLSSRSFHNSMHNAETLMEYLLQTWPFALRHSLNPPLQPVERVVYFGSPQEKPAFAD